MILSLSYVRLELLKKKTGARFTRFALIFPTKLLLTVGGEHALSNVNTMGETGVMSGVYVAKSSIHRDLLTPLLHQ